MCVIIGNRPSKGVRLGEKGDEKNNYFLEKISPGCGFNPHPGRVLKQLLFNYFQGSIFLSLQLKRVNSGCEFLDGKGSLFSIQFAGCNQLTQRIIQRIILTVQFIGSNSYFSSGWVGMHTSQRQAVLVCVGTGAVVQISDFLLG